MIPYFFSFFLSFQFTHPHRITRKGGQAPSKQPSHPGATPAPPGKSDPPWYPQIPDPSRSTKQQGTAPVAGSASVDQAVPAREGWSDRRGKAKE